jgi:hypothetical protein
MINFQQARQFVDKYARPKWNANLGTFMVDSRGYEDDDQFLVIVGAEEALIGGKDTYQLMDPPLFLVDKTTGSINVSTTLEMLSSLDAMRPVR